MFNTLDSGIEAACKSYWRREAILAEAKAEALAEAAAKLPKGSPEWREAAKAFAAFIAATAERGIELVK